MIIGIPKEIKEQEQRVLFVLTQRDVETDSHEGGRVYRSRDDKLAGHLSRLRRDVRECQPPHSRDHPAATI